MGCRCDCDWGGGGGGGGGGEGRSSSNNFVLLFLLFELSNFSASKDILSTYIVCTTPPTVIHESF